MDVCAIARLSVRQQLYHALQAANLPRGNDMEDAHTITSPQVPCCRGAIGPAVLSFRRRCDEATCEELCVAVERFQHAVQFLPPPATMAFDALVLNASLRQALVTVRSLGRRGLRVAAAATVRTAPAFSSRWCKQGFVFPPEDASDAYLARLGPGLGATGLRPTIPS